MIEPVHMTVDLMATVSYACRTHNSRTRFEPRLVLRTQYINPINPMCTVWVADTPR